MALILKRASAYAYGTSGTMTIPTASPTGRGWPHHEGCGSGAAATQSSVKNSEAIEWAE